MIRENENENKSNNLFCMQESLFIENLLFAKKGSYVKKERIYRLLGEKKISSKEFRIITGLGLHNGK